MKISGKLALAAVMLVICSPVTADAQQISSYDSATMRIEKPVKNSENDTYGSSSSPKKSQEKTSGSGSKKSFFGLFSLLFVSIM
ncbi:hypothetical protein [Novosphingobium sp. AAP1]|uniref:hypothetical protein n=1 Tax=Novosphingobium sp. AAP1 TaxID=1523413 RepID=UPI0012E0EA8D|nr:hypothetical protein [Novosphingobium sp. AAP1]